MNTLLTTLSRDRIEEHTTAGHWRDETIYQVARRNAARDPERVAVRERDRATTYGALLDAADHLAAELDAAGLRAGDRVAVWLPSRVETAAAVLACARGGFVVSPSLHRDHTVAQVVELTGRLRARAVLAERGYGADADRYDLAEALAGQDHLRLLRLLEPADRAPLPGGIGPAVSPAVAPDAVAYIAFTSGSTGVPKGVMHSHNTLLAPVHALAADWSIGATSCVYTLSPLSHNLGFGALLLALATGAELVVHDLPRGASLTDRLTEVDASFAFGVPTHAIDLLTELEAHDRRLPALRGFRISGAAVPPTVAQGLLDRGVVPQSGYGMTEAGSHHYTLPSDDPETIVSTSGRACAGFEVRILDGEDPDRELPVGEVGQIASRGASLMLGYFDDQSATEVAFNRAGWFLTGDMGRLDEQGRLTVTGRKKDLIIRGGHNIYPVRIENLALRHARVQRAAAVPVPDERLGERVCLAVQLSDGPALAPEELLAFLADAGLSRYDMPERMVQVDALPLLASGKVSKLALLDLLATGKLVPDPVRYVRTEVGQCAR